MTDSPPEYIDQMLANIVGIEVEVTRMVGKWKPNQNREERDRVSAAEALRERREQELAAAMPGVPDYGYWNRYTLRGVRPTRAGKGGPARSAIRWPRSGIPAMQSCRTIEDRNAGPRGKGW